MERRVTATALTALAGALWASAAGAASSAPVPQSAQPAPMMLASRDAIGLDRAGHVVNLNLGAALPSGTSSLLRSNTNAAAPVFQMNFSHERNLDLYGTLFSGSAGLRSSYLSGTTTSTAASFGLGKKLTFNLGRTGTSFSALDNDQPSVFVRDLNQRLGADLRNAETITANLNWNFAEWGGLGLTASHSDGNGALLGMANGPLASASMLSSNALGVAARVGFGEGWVTSVTYSEGVGQLDLSNSRVMANSDSLHLKGYGIGVAKEGVFGSDALGIAVTRPLDFDTSNTNLVGLTSNLNSMSSTQAHESDVELGYVTSFLDGTLALQANAAYQMNAAGAKGQTALTGVARAKLNF